MRARSCTEYTDSATGQTVTVQKDISTTSQDDLTESSSFHPGSDFYDVHIQQAEHWRLRQEEKSEQLKKKYGEFKDDSPSFPSDENKISLPNTLQGIDRVDVNAQFQSVLEKENKALFQARFFRNRCAELEKRIRQLEDEKEGVRYFWRNQVLECQSRSGKLLKLATMKAAK